MHRPTDCGVRQRHEQRTAGPPPGSSERHRRAEQALTTVVATCYLLGVSTRRMSKLVQTLGITGQSKSQVSVMAQDLDAQVEAFRTRATRGSRGNRIDRDHRRFV